MTGKGSSRWRVISELCAALSNIQIGLPSHTSKPGLSVFAGNDEPLLEEMAGPSTDSNAYHYPKLSRRWNAGQTQTRRNQAASKTAVSR